MAPTTDVHRNGSDDTFAETAFTANGAELQIDDIKGPTTPDRGTSPVTPVASPEIIALVQQVSGFLCSIKCWIPVIVLCVSNET